MQSEQSTAPSAERSAPLSDFTRCHLGIVSQLQASAGLPEMVEAARRARATATATLDLFERVVLPHHAEEESELFPAVLRSANASERETVRALGAKLTAEHREVESQWKKLEPGVRRVARGHFDDIDGPALAAMISAYLRHAKTEETEYLPLAETILRRDGNHMAALEVALHLRHVPEVPGYI